MRNIDVHKHIVPVLYTLLWGVGIYSCSWDWKLFPDFVTYSNAVQGITVIYLIFMAESIVGLLDMAYCHKKEVFNVHIIYWLMMFVSDVFVTLLLTVILLKGDGTSCMTGLFICLSMMFLKYININIANNIDWYLSPLCIKTYVSTF